MVSVRGSFCLWSLRLEPFWGAGGLEVFHQGAAVVYSFHCFFSFMILLVLKFVCMCACLCAVPNADKAVPVAFNQEQCVVQGEEPCDDGRLPSLLCGGLVLVFFLTPLFEMF